MIAALFVRSDSVYRDFEGVDCYDLERNALTFGGGCPVIAHPPCRSWGQLRRFAKPVPGERELAPWAVECVRREGGVLEHPINSGLWAAVGCLSWGVRDRFGGVLVPLLQSWYGHRAPKATSLYCVGCLPELVPGPVGRGRVEFMGKREREATPEPLAAFLVDVVRGLGAGARVGVMA